MCHVYSMFPVNTFLYIAIIYVNPSKTGTIARVTLFSYLSVSFDLHDSNSLTETMTPRVPRYTTMSMASYAQLTSAAWITCVQDVSASNLPERRQHSVAATESTRSTTTHHSLPTGSSYSMGMTLTRSTSFPTSGRTTVHAG